ncbi:MAG: NADH oxidase H2O-forming [Caudoviricetes sp.]|nr:MAG: NADH oxidase H2O-forming [Caudoviricetes sp.]
MRIRLNQQLNLQNDSFVYTAMGEDKPTYIVDSNGYVTKHGEQIGKFSLRDDKWHLYIGDVLKMSGPENGLFYLPEFELVALTALINGEI